MVGVYCHRETAASRWQHGQWSACRHLGLLATIQISRRRVSPRPLLSPEPSSAPVCCTSMNLLALFLRRCTPIMALSLFLLQATPRWLASSGAACSPPAASSWPASRDGENEGRSSGCLWPEPRPGLSFLPGRRNSPLSEKASCPTLGGLGRNGTKALSGASRSRREL